MVVQYQQNSHIHQIRKLDAIFKATDQRRSKFKKKTSLTSVNFEARLLATAIPCNSSTEEQKDHKNALNLKTPYRNIERS